MKSFRRNCAPPLLLFSTGVLTMFFGGLASCSSDPPQTASTGGQATLGPGDGDPIVHPRSKDPLGGGPGAGGSAGRPSTSPLGLCETAAGYSVSQLDGEPLLDDFEDGDPQAMANGRVGYWYTYGDGTGSLSPYGEAVPSQPGRAGSDYALHVVGEDFTYWGSGVGLGLASDGSQDCLHDLSVYSGISFWVRGNVKTTSESVVERDRNVARLLLVEADVAPIEEGGGCQGDAGGCWDAHRVHFAPSECWQLMSFDFSEFVQDGWGQDGGELDLAEVYRMHFEVAAYNDWELWVDDVRFYAGEKPTASPDCGMGGLGGASGMGGEGGASEW